MFVLSSRRIRRACAQKTPPPPPHCPFLSASDYYSFPSNGCILDCLCMYALHYPLISLHVFFPEGKCCSYLQPEYVGRRGPVLQELPLPPGLVWGDHGLRWCRVHLEHRGLLHLLLGAEREGGSLEWDFYVILKLPLPNAFSKDFFTIWNNHSLFRKIRMLNCFFKITTFSKKKITLLFPKK